MKITEKENLEIIWLGMPEPTNNLQGFFIVLKKESNIDEKKIFSELLSLPGVKEVDYPVFSRNLVLSKKLYPVTIDDENAIIFDTGLIKLIYKILRTELRKVADIIIYNIGEVFGEAIYDHLFTETGYKPVSLRETINALDTILKAQGLSGIDDYMIEKNEIIIVTRDFIEGKILRELGDYTSQLYFTLGFLKGYFSKVLGKSVEPRQLQRKTKGIPYDVFVIPR